MPEKDEFGGVAVDDSTDEFGGVPIDEREPGSLYTPEEGARLQAEAERAAWSVPERERGLVAGAKDAWALANNALAHSLDPNEVAQANDVLYQIAKLGAAGVPIPKARLELTRRLAEQPNRAPTAGEQILAGVQNVAAENLTTPLALALPVANKFIPPPLAKAIGVGFAANAVEHLPEAAAEAGTVSARGTPYEKTRAYGNLGASFAIPAAVALDLIPRRSTTPAGKPNVEPPPAETAPAPENVAPVETRPQNVYNGDPVEVLEVNKKKGTALVRPEGKPDAAPDVVPYGEIETREVPVEKGPNASSQQEAATVYGDLRPPAGESPGEVPAAQGQRGVQPQAGGGIRQAEGENGQVPLTPEQIKETTIRERLKEGIKPEDLQIVVNKPGGEELPQANYVQVDDVTPGKNNPFSSNPEQMNQLGFEMPTKADLLKLPQGKYTLPEALAKLEEIKAEKPFSFSELTDAELKKEYDKAISDYEGSPTAKFNGDWMRALEDEISRRSNESRPIGESPAFAGIPPIPISFKQLGSAIVKSFKNLNRTRQALQTIFRSRVNREIMDQTIDAADNKANIAGQQMGNRLRLGTGRMQRMATMAVVEANGNRERLADFLRQAQAGGNKEAADAVRYAQSNWGNLQTDAARVKRILDGQIAAEQTAGIATEYRDAYVPHIYDRDLLMGSGRPFVIAGGSGTGSGFKKGRSFPTIFDAIEQGYVPKTMDVADLVEHRVKVGQKIINRKEWGQSLSTLIDPTDGKPVAAALIRKSRGPGQPGYEVAPPGYRPVEILPGVRIGVHEAYLPLFNALTGESFVAGSAPGKLALEAAGGIKHGLLVFDSFHASRIFQKLLTLSPGKVLSRKAGYKRGGSLLEYSDADLNAAVRENIITPEIATWVRANRANANLLIDNGLNVGRIQEGLYNSVVRDIPGIGPFNKWVFEKLTRGALMEAGLIELERISAAKPTVPRGTIAREVARNLNAYFGNLGRQGIFKSASARDIARLVALAPQWVESMARTELKGAAQTAKGLTYDPVVHKTLLTGSIGKGVAQGLLAYFVGTQILNYVTRGHSTFQNPEDNHKLDAWIPGPKGSHGFFLSPFSVVAELTHDLLRYSSKEPSKWDAAMRIAANKASPMTRALKVLMTGRDYDGKQINDVWARVKAAGFALAPTPIPLAPVIKGSAYPGQTQRQLLGSAGFKVEPAESAAQQIAHKAQLFMQSKGRKPVALELTDEPAFYKLRDALRKNDDTGAKEILDALRKTHSDIKIFKAMQGHQSRPFTDSIKSEGEFRRSLSPQQQDLYRKARDEQREEFQKFKELWYKRRER